MTQNLNYKSKSLPHLLISCAAGLLDGTVNGLIGTGGGIVIVFFLSKIYAKKSIYSTKDIFAMTVGASFMMSVASAAVYLKNGCYKLSDCAVYILPAIAGGVGGALLLDALNSKIFKKIFALLVIWAGISMLIKR